MTGESAREDRPSIQKTLALWCVPGCVYELRALGRGKSSGYFRADPTGLEQLCDNAVMLSRNTDTRGVYLTLNPVDPILLARANHRVVEYAKVMTSDEQVTKRTRLLLDFDAVTPQPGIHANTVEHGEAIARADACRKWLTTEHGWPEPLWTDSGNGSGLIYGLDLANDADALELVSSVLGATAKR